MQPDQVTRFTREARRVVSVVEPTSPASAAQVGVFVGFLVAWVGTVMTSGRGQTLVAILWLGGALAFGLAQSVRGLFVRAPRARRQANAYRIIERADGSDSAGRRVLAPGHVVLRGEVAFAQGADEALQVEIVEAGHEWSNKAGPHHEWVEERRTVTARPFYLVRPGGQRIRVEPYARNTQLFDDLEPSAAAVGKSDEHRRLRVAKLDPREHVWISGQLVVAEDPEAESVQTSTEALPYRELARPAGLVLRGAPTLLVSSVSLAGHFRARAWLHTVQGVVALLFLVAPLLMAGRILDRALGSAEEGVVENSSAVYSGKRPVLVGYAAEVVIDGVRWTSMPFVTALEKGTPYVMRVGRYSANDGPELQVSRGEAMVSFLTCAALALMASMCRFLSIRRLPWFRSVGAFVERGRGHLDLTS